jgi:hypothetical protein
VASGAGLAPGDELRTKWVKTNLRHSGLTGWITAKCIVSNLEVAAFQSADLPMKTMNSLSDEERAWWDWTFAAGVSPFSAVSLADRPCPKTNSSPRLGAGYQLRHWITGRLPY